MHLYIEASYIIDKHLFVVLSLRHEYTIKAFWLNEKQKGMIKTKIHHLVWGSAMLVSTSLIDESTVKSEIRAPVTATKADTTANTVKYDVNRNDIIERVAVHITSTNKAPTNTWP